MRPRRCNGDCAISTSPRNTPLRSNDITQARASSFSKVLSSVRGSLIPDPFWEGATGLIGRRVVLGTSVTNMKCVVN
jgi:hypothetical protein